MSDQHRANLFKQACSMRTKDKVGRCSWQRRSKCKKSRKPPCLMV